MDKEVISFVNERLFIKMQKGAQSPGSSRQLSPTMVKADARMRQSLGQVKSLAQTLLCSANCVANNGDLVFQQVHSFHQDDEVETEGVEIGEESLLRQDYGIYRV